MVVVVVDEIPVVGIIQINKNKTKQEIKKKKKEREEGRKERLEQVKKKHMNKAKKDRQVLYACHSPLSIYK